MIGDPWSGKQKGDGISKMLGRVKPDMPVSKKIEAARKQLRVPLSHLRQIDEKLRAKDEQLLKRVVAAQRAHNNPYALMYANELVQVRKMQGQVHNAAVSLEQVQLRLDTISELGDIVVTLSPCMSVIQDLGPSISGLVPDVGSSMQVFSGMMTDLITSSRMQSDDAIAPQTTRDQGAQEIINEVTSLISQDAQASIPEVPSSLAEPEMSAEKRLPKAPVDVPRANASRTPIRTARM